MDNTAYSLEKQLFVSLKNLLYNCDTVTIYKALEWAKENAPLLSELKQLQSKKESTNELRQQRNQISLFG